MVVRAKDTGKAIQTVPSAGTAILGAVIMMALPEFFMQPLLPNPTTFPPYALASGSAALRIFGAFTLHLAACLHCLADSAAKGNFSKSDTYRCALTSYCTKL
jgi:hypothetical protein